MPYHQLPLKVYVLQKYKVYVWEAEEAYVS